MISSSETLKKTFPEFISILTSKKPVIVDIKDSPSKGIIKNSTFIIFNDKFKALLPSVLKPDAPFLFVCDPLKTDEVLQSLQAIAYSNILGFLEGGFEAWVANKGEISQFNAIESENFKKLYEAKPHELNVLDVRNKNEWENGVLPNARMVSLKDLEQETVNGKLDDLKKKMVYLYCALGPRSMMGSSVLKRHGFEDVTYIIGGYKKMTEVGLELKKPEL